MPADSCGLFSLQPACSVRYTSGMHVRSRQQLDYFREAAARGTCARHHSNRCDLIETTAPEWLPLAACSNAPGVSCMPSDPRASGRPWATAVALASHTSRGSSSLRRRCAVCAAGLGNGHALRLVRPAAQQLTAVAQPLQGPVASARSCVPLRITIDHHRSKPSPEPILDRATKRRCFCGMLAAATTDPRRAALARVPVLAGRL